MPPSHQCSFCCSSHLRNAFSTTRCSWLTHQIARVLGHSRVLLRGQLVRVLVIVLQVGLVALHPFNQLILGHSGAHSL